MTLNAKCLKENRHRFGVCIQECAQCGVEDMVTVNYCDSAESYLCTPCDRAKREAI